MGTSKSITERLTHYSTHNPDRQESRVKGIPWHVYDPPRIDASKTSHTADELACQLCEESLWHGVHGPRRLASHLIRLPGFDF